MADRDIETDLNNPTLIDVEEETADENFLLDAFEQWLRHCWAAFIGPFLAIWWLSKATWGWGIRLLRRAWHRALDHFAVHWRKWAIGLAIGPIVATWWLAAVANLLNGNLPKAEDLQTNIIAPVAVEVETEIAPQEPVTSPAPATPPAPVTSEQPEQAPAANPAPSQPQHRETESSGRMVARPAAHEAVVQQEQQAPPAQVKIRKFGTPDRK